MKKPEREYPDIEFLETDTEAEPEQPEESADT